MNKLLGIIVQCTGITELGAVTIIYIQMDSLYLAEPFMMSSIRLGILAWGTFNCIMLHFGPLKNLLHKDALTKSITIIFRQLVFLSS